MWNGVVIESHWHMKKGKKITLTRGVMLHINPVAAIVVVIMFRWRTWTDIELQVKLQHANTPQNIIAIILIPIFFPFKRMPTIQVICGESSGFYGSLKTCICIGVKQCNRNGNDRMAYGHLMLEIWHRHMEKCSSGK